MISLAGLSSGSDSAAGVALGKEEAFGVLRDMTSPQATGKTHEDKDFSSGVKN